MTQLICRRCELPVGLWAKGADGHVWKHHANGHTKSCGKAPMVVEKAAYDKEMSDFVSDAMMAIQHRIEPAKKPCPSCDGFGYHNEDDECEVCEGNGMATPSAIRWWERQNKA